MEIEHNKQGDVLIVNILSNRLDAQGADEFKEKIGADFYSPDPQGAIEYLNQMVA